MQDYKINKYSMLGVVFSAVFSFNMMTSARAQDINAGYVLNKMNAEQRVSYVEGVIEGLAYSRFLRDRPDESGMNCIYQWYDRDHKARWQKVKLFFARHSDKPVGVLLFALYRKECGE